MLKRNRISLEQASKAIQVYREIPIRFVDVELEQPLKSRLISLDGNLASSAKGMKAKVIEVK